MLKCWCQCAWNHLLCHWLTVRLWVFLSVPVFFHVWPCHSCFRYPVIVTQQLHSWLRTQMPRKIQTHTNTAPAACEWFKPYHMSTSSFSDVMLQRAGRQVPISPYIALSDSVTGDRVTNTYIHTGTLFTGSADHRNHYNPSYQGTEGNRQDNAWQRKRVNDRGKLDIAQDSRHADTSTSKTWLGSDTQQQEQQHRSYCGGVSAEDTGFSL